MQLVRIVGPAADMQNDACGRACIRRALQIGDWIQRRLPYSAA